jgi:hypothetical protein
MGRIHLFHQETVSGRNLPLPPGGGDAILRPDLAHISSVSRDVAMIGAELRATVQTAFGP